MKITTQPRSTTEVTHTLYDAGELDERTSEATRAEVHFAPQGVGLELFRSSDDEPIGDVYVEVYEGKLRSLSWRQRDLGNDPVKTVTLFDYLEEHAA
jgi:hypothetical protein